MRHSEDVDSRSMAPVDVVKDAEVPAEIADDPSLLHGLAHRRLLRALVGLDFAARDDPAFRVTG